MASALQTFRDKIDIVDQLELLQTLNAIELSAAEHQSPLQAVKEKVVATIKSGWEKRNPTQIIKLEDGDTLHYRIYEDPRYIDKKEPAADFEKKIDDTIVGLTVGILKQQDEIAERSSRQGGDWSTSVGRKRMVEKLGKQAVSVAVDPAIAPAALDWLYDSRFKELGEKVQAQYRAAQEAPAR